MKHGMKPGKKRPTRFYGWLNVTVFHKAMSVMKLSHDDKRITECVDHKLERKEKPFFRAPAVPKCAQRGK